MSVLVDWQIRNLSSEFAEPKLLYPFSEGVQGDGVISYGLTSSGYDFRLGGNLIKVFKNSFNEIISPKRFKSNKHYQARLFDEIENVADHEPVLIPPHGYILGYTVEYITMPKNLKAHCVGKSTLARCGLLVNTTPLEPGWTGHLTLEIANVTPCPIEIYVGEGIAQCEFHRLDAIPQQDYEAKGGKYMNQGPEPIVARVKP